MRVRAITAWLRSRYVPAGRLTFVGPQQFVVCHFCGLAFLDLVQHVRGRHHLSAEQYRRTWSLPPDTKLISPTLAAKRADDPWLARGGRL
jgi:predicted transcriptional regulator